MRSLSWLKWNELPFCSFTTKSASVLPNMRRSPYSFESELLTGYGFSDHTYDRMVRLWLRRAVVVNWCV